MEETNKTINQKQEKNQMNNIGIPNLDDSWFTNDTNAA